MVTLRFPGKEIIMRTIRIKLGIAMTTRTGRGRWGTLVADNNHNGEEEEKNAKDNKVNERGDGSKEKDEVNKYGNKGKKDKGDDCN